MIETGKSILSIETATPVCSVALRLPNGQIFEKRAVGKGVHSELTFVFIEELLGEHKLEVRDLGALIISAGPGSYTGLRVASSAAKGILFETGIPLFACQTLGAFAFAARELLIKNKKNGVTAAGSDSGMMTIDNRNIAGFAGCETVIDARRNHLYHQVWRFVDNGIEPDSGVVLQEIPEVLDRWVSGCFLVGTGVDRIRMVAAAKAVSIEKLPVLSGADAVNAGHVLHALGRISQNQLKNLIKKVAPEHFEPYYYSGL